jgi:transcriptional regulator with XRE-family HTH domain
LSEEKEARWKAFGRMVAQCRRNLADRLGRKVTQQEIADLVGIHKNQLGRIENGASGTEYETVRGLAEALQVPPLQWREFFAMAGFVYSPAPRGSQAFVLGEGTTPLRMDKQDAPAPVVLPPAVQAEVNTIYQAIKNLQKMGVNLDGLSDNDPEKE